MRPGSGTAGARLAAAARAVLAGSACGVLFAMMLLTFADVVGRYLLARPLPAAYEIISFMMPVLIFCALPLVSRSESHVTIDLLDNWVPRAVRRPQAVFVNVLGALAVGFIGWRLWVLAGDQRLNDDVSTTLYLPLAPFSIFMAVMSAVAAAALALNALLHALGRGEPPGGRALDRAPDSAADRA